MWQRFFGAVVALLMFSCQSSIGAGNHNEGMFSDARIVTLSTPSLGPCSVGNIPGLTEKEHELAINIYWEGWYEPLKSQYMIGQVVLARMSDVLFPNTLNGVIRQKNAFSWTIERSKRNLSSKYFHKRLWHRAQLSAHAVIRSGLVLKKEWSCVRFYKRTDNIAVSKRSEGWFGKYLNPVGVVGSHTFYCYKPEVRMAELVKHIYRQNHVVRVAKKRIKRRRYARVRRVSRARYVTLARKSVKKRRFSKKRIRKRRSSSRRRFSRRRHRGMYAVGRRVKKLRRTRRHKARYKLHKKRIKRRHKRRRRRR